MPSYYRDGRKYRGKNRYQILEAIRAERAQKEELERAFASILNGIPSFINKKKEKLRFHQLLYELRRDGLILPDKKNDELFYALTAKGLMWLKKFKQHQYPGLPVYSQAPTPHGAVTIVSYDVPERVRYLRRWLRSSLRNFGLKPMQRSVWIGKVKVPEQFIKDIAQLKLTKHVALFEITKAGTLRHRI